MTNEFGETDERSRPVRRIGEVARLLGVHPRTVRLYEEAGLVSPDRRRGQRLFSDNDVQWLECLRRLIHEKGYGLAAVRRLLDYAPCWELLECGHGTDHECPAACERGFDCREACLRVCRRGATQCDGCELNEGTEEARNLRRAAD